MGDRVRPLKLMIRIWVGLFYTTVLANPNGMPGDLHYQASKRGRDCSIYRHLLSQTREQISNHHSLLKSVVETVKQARKQLESCALEYGAQDFGRPQAETLMAELCPDAYDAWLEPSYRVRMLEQDIQAAQETVVQVNARLQYYCQLRLPTKASTSD